MKAQKITVKRMIKNTAAMLLTAALLVCACACSQEPQSTDKTEESYSILTSPVYITEVCTKNSLVLADNNGDYYDFIELYNPTSGRVSLKGYYLSDNEKKPKKWSLPDTYIEAGEYMVLFASGNDCFDGKYWHTSFSVSSQGETVTLLAPDGAFASRVTAQSGLEDISYGLLPGQDKYVYFSYPTPGRENSGDYASTQSELVFDKASVRINEYLTGGEPGDFIELYNHGDKAEDLSGMYLSDDPLDPEKWQIPQGTVIEAGGYLVISAGKGEGLSTDFSLSCADEALLLTDKRASCISRVDIQALPKGISAGYTENGFKFFNKPTPGGENNTPYSDIPQLYKQTGLAIGRVCATPNGVNGWDHDVITVINTSDAQRSLQGFTLSLGASKSYTFSDVTLEAGEELVLYASGETPSKPEKNRIYLPFKVSVSGETVLLCDPEGDAADEFATGKLRKGVVSYREQGKRYFTDGGLTATSYQTPPTVLSDGGYAKVGDKVEVLVPDGARVYYTDDGSTPTDKDKLYTSPITIEKGCSLRFVAYSDSTLPSDVVTRTFITEEKHLLPIMCISGDPDDYFSNARGIFALGNNPGEAPYYSNANFRKDWEREAAMEYFTLEGLRALEFNAGIKIHGAYSRMEKQKSMAVHLRNDYGSGDITYPFFNNNSVTTLGSFVLRTGGQDWNRGKLRDSFISLVAKGTTNLAVMDAAPVAVYFNGEYFGLYFLREKLGKDYFNTHYGIEEENLEYLRANSTVLHGSNKEYKELIKYVNNNDMSKDEHYQYVSSKVDLLSYIDWWVFETWFANSDSGNIKFFRDKQSGKWTWCLFDMDWALFRSTYKNNYLSKVYKNGHGVSSMFSTELIRGLLKNAEFKQLFISRYSHHVKNTLNPDRLFAMLNAQADAIRAEIPRQHKRWGSPSASSWEHTIYRLKVIFIEKIDITKSQMRSVFKLSQAEVDELFTPSYDKENIQKQIDDYK
ncbi:MAG: lamin tail domain-containing protein [Clostridia bacterium]|nr:lamin tail domain-containing protein [Clostridia bacterium]